MNKVLVLCVGNVCRSPAAEAILKQELPGLVIESAGLHATAGSPAHSYIVELVQERRHVDIGSHRATRLTRDKCMRADLILVMDERQRIALHDLYPECRGKVYKLASDDIADPINQPKEFFLRIFSEVEIGAVNWAQRIRQARAEF